MKSKTYYAQSAECLICGATDGYIEKGWWLFKRNYCIKCGKEYIGIYSNIPTSAITTSSGYIGLRKKKTKVNLINKRNK